MTRHFYLYLIIVLLINGCFDNINTTTPQASSSIFASQQDGFYLSIANKLQGGTMDIIDSVWNERVWHYEIINGKRKKVVSSTNNQIILRLKDPIENFKKNNYFLEWRMEEKHLGDLASGNGVFMLRYPQNYKIDTLHLFLYKMPNDSAIDIGTFLLK